ncbi:hypothetical protein ACP70R_021957 [Stipagrostis hirtigluma subsp. patula]
MDHWLMGTPLEIMDPLLDCLQLQTPESEVMKCIHLGLLCVQEDPADRPAMLDVLVMLHGQELCRISVELVLNVLSFSC